MKPRPELSILVFSEDHGAQVEPALCALLKKMLILVEPACRTHKDCIEFLPADEDSRTALRGKRHGGRDARGHLHRRLLAGKIADQIAKGHPHEPDGFVAYHQDGDRRWSERTPADFPEFVRLMEVVSALLEAPRRKPENRIDPARIERVLLLAPYWELEAWLYQNIDAARRLCRELHGDNAEHTALFDRWEAARASLDEVPDPKDVCCLHDRHNLALAESAYPKDAAYGADASFRATTDRLRECPALRAALARTRAA